MYKLVESGNVFRPYRCAYLLTITALGYLLCGWYGVLLVGLASEVNGGY